MWWGFSGKLKRFNFFPVVEQMFEFRDVKGLFMREGSSPDAQHFSEVSGFSVMKLQIANDVIANLLEHGRFIGHQQKSFAFVWNSNEACSLILGLDDNDFDSLVANIGQFKTSRFGCSGIARFAPMASAGQQKPTENDFEEGSALMLDSFRFSISDDS